MLLIPPLFFFFIQHTSIASRGLDYVPFLCCLYNLCLDLTLYNYFVCHEIIYWSLLTLFENKSFPFTGRSPACTCNKEVIFVNLKYVHWQVLLICSYLHFLNMIDIAIIVGAASGVIVFNFILVTWCLFCHWHRRQGPSKVELQTTALRKRSPLLKPGEKRTVKFAASVKDSRNKYASYPASRLRPPHVPSPLASAKVRTRRFDRPRAENLFPQNLSESAIVPTITDHAPSVRSDDTASVYSTASAPLEIHDYLLRSHNSPNNILVTSASSPSEMLSMATTSSRNVNISPPSSTGNCLSVMEKGLFPKAAIQQRPRQANRRWCQQQSVSREMSREQSVCCQIPNPIVPPGLSVLPQTAQNNEQGPSSTPLPSPYSPPSK